MRTTDDRAGILPPAPAVTTRRLWPVLRQLVVFALVGGAFNVVYGLLYVLFRESMGTQAANVWALVLSTLAGTWGHRRVTFGVRSSTGTVRHQTLGLLLLGFSLLVTSGSLWLLDATVTEPSRVAELVVLAAANLGVGLVRFGVFRVVMVPGRPAAEPAPDPA